MKTALPARVLAARGQLSWLTGCFLLLLSAIFCPAEPPNPDPLPIGEWPGSVDPTPNSTLTMTTVDGHQIKWEAHLAAGRRQRIPRLFVGTLNVVAVDTTGAPKALWLYDLGVQQKKGGQLRRIWFRVTKGTAKLHRHKQGEGGDGEEIRANAQGYYEIDPCYWDPAANVPKGEVNYRLVAVAGTEFQCVYADKGLGWPKRGISMQFLQDDNGFPPPPFPGEEH